MQPEIPGRVEEGWRALEAAEWEQARSVFEAVLAVEEPAEALDGQGLALWFLGDVDEGLALRERAFAAYARDGDCSRGARVAVWISRQYLISGRASAAGGWLARAERVLDATPTCAGHGWITVERARQASSVKECAEGARRALEIAREYGDDDLEVFALSVLGPEVSSGRLDESARMLRRGDGRGDRGAGPQRAHARRGVPQLDHRLHGGGRLGAGERVVPVRR
jgi:hypothetical protein